MDVLNRLKLLDAYPKVNEDFYSRTLSGGIITLISSFIMAILFLTELREWISLKDRQCHGRIALVADDAR